MEIGQQITWIIKDKTFTGIFFENLENGFSKVKCLTQNDRPFIINTEVLTDLLQIIE
jgi:hypothetical protein